MLERKSLRYTPAGLPVSEAVLEHASQQMEADVLRQVSCEIALIALGQSAQWLQAVSVGGAVKVTGFLAAKSRNSKTPVLHVNSLSLIHI